MNLAIDRVFFKGISTVSMLSADGLPRPPADTRAQLYGLYKQATDGDVRMLRGHRPDGDDEIGQKKWDAWKSFEGVEPPEAKKRYVALLLDTMSDYTATSDKARELLGDLQREWDEIRDLPVTPERNDRDDTPPHQYDDHRHHHQQQQAVLDTLATPAAVPGGMASSPSVNSLGLGINHPVSRVSSLIPPADHTLGGKHKSSSRHRRETDIDDAELRQWKREVSRAMETLNDQVLVLRNQVTELTRPYQRSYGRKIMAVARPLLGLFLKVGRHVFIDLVVLVLALFMIRTTRRKLPQSQLAKNLDYWAGNISRRLAVYL